MVLNSRQKRALIVGVMGFIAIGCYPPWKDSSPPPAGTPLNFAPITLPPAIANHSIEIDTIRLGVLWILISVVTGAAILATKDKEFKTSKSGVTSVSDFESIIQMPGAERASAAAKDIAKAAYAQAVASQSSSSLKSVPPKNAAKEKDSHKYKFPDRKVGELLQESDDDDEYWQFVSEASGRVEVPGGSRLQIEFAKDAKADLSFLPSMGNKEARSAIVSLDLSQTTADAEALSYLKWLPQLEELDLSGTNIGDEDLAALSAVSGLKKIWLDDTKVTAQAVQALSNLSELKKLSITHLESADSDINSLKLKLPACEVVVGKGNS